MKSKLAISLGIFIFYHILFLLPSHSSAESEFEKWKKQELGEFKEFRDERDRAFTRFLKKQWREFKLFKGEKIYERPKPKKLPVAKKRPPGEVTPLKGKIVKKVMIPKIKPAEKPSPPPIISEPKPKPVPAQEPERLVKPSPPPPTAPSIKKRGKVLSFNFYGRDVEISYDPRLKAKLAKKIDNRAISSFWEELSQAGYEELVNQTEYHKRELKLNDWGYHLFVYGVGERIYGKPSQKEINMFVWFVLTKSDYDAKIGYNRDNVYLLLPSKNKLYGIPFLDLRGKRYYAVSFDGKKRKMSSLFTYKGKYPGADELMYYRIESTPDIEKVAHTRKLKFSYRGKNYELSVRFNKAVVNYFEFYPQTNFEVYFDAPVSPEARFSLLTALKPLVEGKSEGEAVNLLMRFVQTAFEYKTDDGQFGREKYMLPEETIFYPYSDCEDRSILFSYLVRNLTGLDVVALHYPNHIATAVNFTDDIKGDYIIYKGKKYIISDPTYVNADVGMAMPRFKNVKPKVIPIGKRV